MTAELQHNIYDLIKSKVLSVVRHNSGLMNIFSSVWDVYQRKSTGKDYRYQVLGDEIEKHYVMNEDWSDDELFVTILQLFDNEQTFINFVEQITNLFQSDSGCESYRKELSRLLTGEHLALHENRSESDELIYRVGDDQKKSQRPLNELKIYVCKSNVYNIVLFNESDIKWPDDQNCFVLTNDNLWNDYSYYTRYRLYYVKNGNNKEIGEVKIMKKGEENTSQILPKEFYSLDADYCSLGCNLLYYSNMKKELGTDAPIVLRQLRDTAFYESIYKDFERDNIYRTSLLRTNESEKARREGRYYVYGRDMKNAYSFIYHYKLPYPGDDIEIEFNYKYNGKDYERIIGMIGENGVGKTTLIKQILQSLVRNDNTQFSGLRPLFSSVLMISYSPFDCYMAVDNSITPFINYEYSGLMKGEAMMYTTDNQVDILIENVKVIFHRQESFYKIWKTLVNKVIPSKRIEPLFKEVDAENIEVDRKQLLALCKDASSGETMYLYSISAIMAKIRSNSLIIMDEPEQHLHPSAVTAMMHSVYKILEMYDSYALISTHSPYVIRDLVSPNVMIFKRFENGLNVSRIGIESFGADVSVLSDVVFDNMSEVKRYERFIEEIVKKKNYDYEDSVRELQTGPNELSINAKLLVRCIIDKKQRSNEAPES